MNALPHSGLPVTNRAAARRWCERKEPGAGQNRCVGRVSGVKISFGLLVLVAISTCPAVG